MASRAMILSGLMFTTLLSADITLLDLATLQFVPYKASVSLNSIAVIISELPEQEQRVVKDRFNTHFQIPYEQAYRTVQSMTVGMVTRKVEECFPQAPRKDVDFLNQVTALSANLKTYTTSSDMQVLRTALTTKELVDATQQLLSMSDTSLAFEEAAKAIYDVRDVLLARVIELAKTEDINKMPVDFIDEQATIIDDLGQKFKIAPYAGAWVRSLESLINTLLRPTDSTKHSVTWYLEKSRNYADRSTVQAYANVLKMVADIYENSVAKRILLGVMRTAREATATFTAVEALWNQFDKHIEDLSHLLQEPNPDLKMIKTSLKTINNFVKNNNLTIQPTQTDDKNVQDRIKKVTQTLENAQKAVEKAKSEKQLSLSKEIDQLYTELSPFWQLTGTAALVRISDVLNSYRMVSIVQRLFAYDNPKDPKIQEAARKLFEVIDLLLSRYIVIAKTEEDVPGKFTELIRSQAPILRLLEEQFNLRSFVLWWRNKPFSRREAGLLLKLGLTGIKDYINNPVQNLPFFISRIFGIFTDFPLLLQPLSTYITNSTVTSSDLILPLANLSRGWRWFRILGGTSSDASNIPTTGLLEWSDLVNDVWYASWWVGAANIALSLLRIKEGQELSTDPVRRLEQGFYNALAVFQSGAIAQIAETYNIEKLKDRNVNLIYDKILRKTPHFIISTQEASRSNDIKVLKAALRDPLLKEFVDSYARREEMYPLTSDLSGYNNKSRREYYEKLDMWYKLPPFKALDNFTSTGAKTLYAYIDEILNRVIESLLAQETLSDEDIESMQKGYDYLSQLDEEYALHQGWFGTTIGATDALAQLKSGDILDEVGTEASVILRDEEASLDALNNILQRLNAAIDIYRKAGGKTKPYINLVLKQLKAAIKTQMELE